MLSEVQRTVGVSILDAMGCIYMAQLQVHFFGTLAVTSVSQNMCGLREKDCDNVNLYLLM